MGYVSYFREYATIADKHKIRKMLEYLGITHPSKQIEFLSELLGEPFDTATLSAGQAMLLKHKIKNLQTEKETKQ